MWWPFWNVTSADQSNCKGTIQSFHSDVSCMESCTILLELLLFLMHATMGTECPPELVENHNVTLFIDCHYLSNIILKPKRSDYAMFQYVNPRIALYRVQWSEKDFIWCLRSPEHRVIAFEMAWYREVGFFTEPHILKKIWIFFNRALESLAHLNTFCHVILCESLFDLDSVWVQLKVIFQDFVNGWTRKTQLLRASPEWLFWTLPNRISHCISILWGSCCQHSSTCWFLSFFDGLYQCSCVLEFLYPASNLELMGKVIEINLLRYLAWTVFSDFVSR